MKITIRMFIVGMTLGASCLAFASDKAETYAVVGYFEGRMPAQALVDKAAKEIGEKMKGLAALPTGADADQVVQVLFKRDGTYRIYWDALPLNGARLGDGLSRAKDRAYLAFEAQMENAAGHGRANVR